MVIKMFPSGIRNPNFATVIIDFLFYQHEWENVSSIPQLSSLQDINYLTGNLELTKPNIGHWKNTENQILDHRLCSQIFKKFNLFLRNILNVLHFKIFIQHVIEIYTFVYAYTLRNDERTWIIFAIFIQMDCCNVILARILMRKIVNYGHCNKLRVKESLCSSRAGFV